MKDLILKLNHIVFWWYYKRVTPYYGCFTILESIETLMRDNTENFHKWYGISKEKSLTEGQPQPPQGSKP